MIKPYEQFHRPEFQTFDWGVAVEVNINNCYALPDTFSRDDVILDVGAHIGYFSEAVLRRGAGKVYAFEPHPLNFKRVQENLQGYGDRFKVTNCAVWRSDGSAAGSIRMSGFNTSDPMANTGGSTVAMQFAEGVEVIWASLDSVLSQLETVRLLKLDCEGSEYPILFTATRLSQVQEIVAEVHPQIIRDEAMVRGKHPTGMGLEIHLRSLGFDAHFKEIKDGWGYIFAKR